MAVDPPQANRDFLPAGASPWWPFRIGNDHNGRPAPRDARSRLVLALIAAIARRHGTDLRDHWRSWPKDQLASLMHAGTAGVDHPSRTFMTSLVRPGDRILDVGCGAGVNYLTLKRVGLGERYVGLDSSQPSIEIARELYPEGEFVVGDALTLSEQFAAREFDVVVVRHVLEHLPDFEPALREAISVARRLALFIFFITPRQLPFGVRKLNTGISPPFYANAYSRAAIEQVLARQPGLEWTWRYGLGPSRTAWLTGEENSALLVTRKPR